MTPGIVTGEISASSRVGSASDCRVSNLVAASISQSNAEFLSVSLIKRNQFCYKQGQWVSSEDPPSDFLSGSEQSLEAEPAAAQTRDGAPSPPIGSTGSHTHTLWPRRSESTVGSIS